MKVNVKNSRPKPVIIDGHRFPSRKEANFYSKFVRDSKADFEVHPKFEIAKPFTLGGKRIAHTVYTPDVVIYDGAGQILHVYDVKNGFTGYAIDAAAKLRFKLFTERYKRFVEIVVVRANDFKTSAYLYESLTNVHIRTSIYY